LQLSSIQRAVDPAPAAVEHVRVDHGGLDVGVAEQLLHSADVVARLKQMGGEGVAPMSLGT